MNQYYQRLYAWFITKSKYCCCADKSCWGAWPSAAVTAAERQTSRGLSEPRAHQATVAPSATLAQYHRIAMLDSIKNLHISLTIHKTSSEQRWRLIKCIQQNHHNYWSIKAMNVFCPRLSRSRMRAVCLPQVAADCVSSFKLSVGLSHERVSAVLFQSRK